jgi:hypothetical protein
MIDRSRPIYKVTWKRKDVRNPEWIHNYEYTVVAKNKTEAISKEKAILRSVGALTGAYAFSATISPLWTRACDEEDAVMARLKKKARGK